VLYHGKELLKGYANKHFHNNAQLAYN